MAFEKAKAHLEKYGMADRIIVTEHSSATVAEAAEALGIHPVALKSRLRRAKAMLKSQLIELKEE